MSDKCIIISGAPHCYIPLNALRADFVIACDSGYLHALRANIKPDLVIGDFDSYNGSLQEAAEIIRSVPEKDDTDTLMALREALKRGYRRIALLGALGGRFDHMIANIQLSAFAAENDALCYLLDEHHQIFAIRNRTCRIKRNSWRWLSVFALDNEISGVTLSGVKYTLDNAILKNTFPRGVSNEFTEAEAELTVKDGTMLIVLTDI